MSLSLAARGATRTGGALDRVWTAAIGFSLALAALFLAHPLGVASDYPNHLARTYIEGWLAHSQTLGAYYEVEARIIPDLAMDLVVPWLSHAIGVYPAGAVMVFLSAVLAPLAGVALSRRLHGRGGGWLALAGFLSVFSLPMEFGFVNFLVSVGLALWAFVLWTGGEPSWRRALIFIPIGMILVLAHALGFLLLGYLALLWEVGAWRAGERGDARRFLTRLAGEGALAFGPALALLAVGMATGVGEISPYPGAPLDLGQRHVALASAFLFHSGALSIAATSAATVFVAAGLYFGLRGGRLALHPRMAPVCIGLALLVAVAPVHVFGVWGLHFRYGAALVVVVGAALRFEADRAIIRRSGVVFACVLAFKAGVGAMNVAAADAELQELRAAFRHVPAGARILPAAEPRFLTNVNIHGVNLAVIERDAYAPSLFTNTSPVAVAPPMRARHRPQALPPTPAMLLEAADKPLPAAENGQWSDAFYYCWPAGFTHVVQFKSEKAAEISHERLTAIRRARTFVLYAVENVADAPGTAGCAPSPAAGFRR